MQWRCRSGHEREWHRRNDDGERTFTVSSTKEMKYKGKGWLTRHLWICRLTEGIEEDYFRGGQKRKPNLETGEDTRDQGRRTSQKCRTVFAVLTLEVWRRFELTATIDCEIPLGLGSKKDDRTTKSWTRLVCWETKVDLWLCHAMLLILILPNILILIRWFFYLLRPYDLILWVVK